MRGASFQAHNRTWTRARCGGGSKAQLLYSLATVTWGKSCRRPHSSRASLGARPLHIRSSAELFDMREFTRGTPLGRQSSLTIDLRREAYGLVRQLTSCRTRQTCTYASRAKADRYDIRPCRTCAPAGTGQENVGVLSMDVIRLKQSENSTPSGKTHAGADQGRRRIRRNTPSHLESTSMTCCWDQRRSSGPARASQISVD